MARSERLHPEITGAKSSSPYASPIVLVRKKDGKLWLCVDYCLLNAKTHKDAYPFSHIDEAPDVLKGAEYFCSLDLAHGFNQIPMRESDIEKTTFRTETGGLYKYTRMPFRLCNVLGTFTRPMDKAFGDLKGTVSRVVHVRLSASRSTHAVISRHYRYGFRRR